MSFSMRAVRTTEERSGVKPTLSTSPICTSR